MEADSHPSSEPERAHRGFEPLEAQLRRLPRPAVPEDFEAKLTAAIPASLPARVRRTLPKGFWRWAGGAGVAAAVVAVCAVRPLFQGAPGAARRSEAVKSGGVNLLSSQIAISDPKETDPCDILPPLPDWR
jgi:hypothetical protein